MERLTIAAIALLLVLAGCASGPEPGSGLATDDVATGAGEMLLTHGLDGMAPQEVIDHLDRLPVAERPADLLASVRPDVLVLSDGEQEVALDVPADQFYLSVAPYVDQTHDCFHHSLTTCQGELAGELVQVRVLDEVTGEVLLDETRTTFDNGFLGLWLPREVRGTVEITSDGRTGSAEFSTTQDGATCLTTLRLV